MSRSPLSYPLNRHADMDAGGAADLQTDVMRFMAIISLCLVAIFALVQSLPTPTAPLPDPASEPAPPPAPVVKRELPKPDPKPATVPEPVVQQASAAVADMRMPELDAATPPATAFPKAQPDTSPPLASSAPPSPRKEAAASAEQEGFSLRFESDRALKRLVANKDIGLYALERGSAMRMAVDGGALSFWPASSPRQIYEMDEATVPAEVVGALRRSAPENRVQWGVTLPRSMTRDLDRYLMERAGGALVIQSNGRLVLEE